MSGLAFEWDQYGRADFYVEENDLGTSDDLRADVYLSLFEDRRANDGDTLPDDSGYRGGSWMDAVPDVDGDLRGSRLWLLRRSLRVQETLDRAKEYCVEALAWLIEDRVSDRVDVSTEFIRDTWMAITVTVHRPKQEPATFRYQYNWQAHEVIA